VNWRLVLVGWVIDGQSEGHWVSPLDLSTKPGQPHSITGIWLHLYLVIDGWRIKLVAWDLMGL